jgi:hypothetical protein
MIDEIFRPRSMSSTKRVTTGPGSISMTEAFTLKSASSVVLLRGALLQLLGGLGVVGSAGRFLREA